MYTRCIHNVNIIQCLDDLVRHKLHNCGCTLDSEGVAHPHRVEALPALCQPHRIVTERGGHLLYLQFR